MREKFKERRWTADLGLQTLELRLQAFSKETRTLVVLVENPLLQDIWVWRVCSFLPCSCGFKNAFSTV